MTYADVVEAVRATIARYTHALDDGRTDDVVATFTEDGSFEMAGMDPAVGTDALRATYQGWKPRRPQRHLVSNTLVRNWSDDEAQSVSDVVLVTQGKEGAWNVAFVARYHDTLRNVDGHWLFARRQVVQEGG